MHIGNPHRVQNSANGPRDKSQAEANRETPPLVSVTRLSRRSYAVVSDVGTRYVTSSETKAPLARIGKYSDQFCHILAFLTATRQAGELGNNFSSPITTDSSGGSMFGPKVGRESGVFYRTI